MNSMTIQKFIAGLFSVCMLLSVATYAAPVMPSDGFSSGWTIAPSSYREFTAEDLYGHINGGAELFLEYGFTELKVQRYQHGEAEIGLEIYVMASPEAALGIYLAKCGKEAQDKRVNARNNTSTSQVIALKNNCYIKANSYTRGEDLLPVLIQAVNAVLDRLEASPEITLLDVLPTEGLIAGSEKLVRGEFALQPFYTFGDGDILLLGGEIFGVTGKYALADGTTFSRLVIEYPTEDAAQKAFANLVADLDPYLTVQEKQADRLVWKDYNNEYGIAVVDGKVLDIRIKLKEVKKE